MNIKKRVFLQHLSNAIRTLAVVPVVGLEPTRVISPTDFESVTSANSITPASIKSKSLMFYLRNQKTSWKDIKNRIHIKLPKVS